MLATRRYLLTLEIADKKSQKSKIELNQLMKPYKVTIHSVCLEE